MPPGRSGTGLPLDDRSSGWRFFPPFDQDELGNPRNALKIVVLITDDAPGGFCDSFTATVKENAERYAQMARCNDIRIAAILVGNDSLAKEVMLDYAAITGGWFTQLSSNGTGIEDAILEILHGELPDYNTLVPEGSNLYIVEPCVP